VKPVYSIGIKFGQQERYWIQSLDIQITHHFCFSVLSAQYLNKKVDIRRSANFEEMSKGVDQDKRCSVATKANSGAPPEKIA